MTRDVYTHGHHESVLRSHSWRTAENSARYLLGPLRPGINLLDVGCGPGTITVDFARRVAPGRVVGIDRSPDVVDQAKRHAESAGVAVSIQVADVYALEFPDASFDVVHAHQVLQHLTDPVAALREMRRVTRRGGTVAVRDSDYSCFSWAPLDPLLTRWLAVYRAVARQNGAEPDAGRFLKGWARAAEFLSVAVTSSTWIYADAASCAWGEISGRIAASTRLSESRLSVMASRPATSSRRSRELGGSGPSIPTLSSPCCTARYWRAFEPT